MVSDTNLIERLNALIERLVDLHPPTRDNYYHPDMLGSWSIKAVIPTVAPELDYKALEEVQEGMGAQRAYLEGLIRRRLRSGRSICGSSCLSIANTIRWRW